MSIPGSVSGRGAAGRPSALDQGPCYHCDRKSPSNSFCENWRVWSCTGCLASSHRPHHQTCKVELPKNGALVERAKQTHFIVSVTRYDGLPFPLQCQLGDKLHMEDHWLGTYIFGRRSMILVREKRDQINEKILQGLKSIR